MQEIEFRSNAIVDLIRCDAKDEYVAQSARVSTKGVESVEAVENIEGLINYLVREKHHSPLEHNSFSFLVQCPIFVAREMVRHRIGNSINEHSGRYSTMEPIFYVPANNRPMIQHGKVGHYQFTDADEDTIAITQQTIRQNSRESWNRYLDLKSRGVANEVSRMCLPLNIYTSYWWTCNARSLMNFLTLRLADNALFEIRNVAALMENYFRINMEITYNAWRKYGI